MVTLQVATTSTGAVISDPQAIRELCENYCFGTLNWEVTEDGELTIWGYDDFEVYEARGNGLPDYEGGIVTHESLRKLADHLEADEELDIQTAGFIKCRFPILAKRYAVRDGEVLHADLSSLESINEWRCSSPERGAGRPSRGAPCEGGCSIGHHALVACERTDGQYTFRYSHWGAANLKLKHQISAKLPFSGDDADSKWAKQLLAEFADGLEADAVDGYLADEDHPLSVVEPKPRATELTLDEIVADHFNYLHHKAFFVVSTTFGVTTYRTLWFGLQYDSETVERGEIAGNGTLATVCWYNGGPVGDGHLQGQFVALKDVVGDMFDKGIFTPSTARQYLKRKLTERVGNRQELLIPTGESPFEKASLNHS